MTPPPMGSAGGMTTPNTGTANMTPQTVYSTMNNANNNNLLENGPRAKCDQVVFEAIAKAAEIVVGSRGWIGHVPSSSNANGATPSSSRRFNLLVPEVEGVRYVKLQKVQEHAYVTSPI